MIAKALVTGSTGFIGRSLTNRLFSEGWTVASLVRGGSDVSGLPQASSKHVLFKYDGGLDSVLSPFKEFKPDIVFHLASSALTEHEPEQVEELVCSNILLGAQVLEAMAAVGCKSIINTGSFWQHYNSKSYSPVNLYAATKQAFEDILLYYQAKHKFSAITLKLYDTYGPGDKRRKVVGLIVDALRSGQELNLSPGEQIIDITYIDDVVDTFVAAARYCLASKEPFNESFFVSGERFSLKDMVEEVSVALGMRGNINFGGRPYRKREIMVPIEAINAKIPWAEEKPRTKLRDGVRLL